MRSATVRHSITALVATGLLVGLAAAGHAQFVLYDDFSSGTILPRNWVGSSVEGASDSPTAELIRVVENGHLHLALVSWGNAVSDTGSLSTRQGLSMKQLGTPGGSGFITGLRAKVTVLNATAQECTSNTIAASQASAQLIGSFFDGDFNDGGSATILGVFQLQKDSDGGNRIVAALLQCPVVFCFLFPPTPIALPGNPAVFSMAWSLDTPLILKFVWDEVNGKFTFAVTDPATLGTESRDIVYLGTVTNARPPSLHFKNVRVSNTVENCSTGRKAALMDALFDNVKVMRQP